MVQVDLVEKWLIVRKGLLIRFNTFKDRSGMSHLSCTVFILGLSVEVLTL